MPSFRVMNCSPVNSFHVSRLAALRVLELYFVVYRVDNVVADGGENEFVEHGGLAVDAELLTRWQLLGAVFCIKLEFQMPCAIDKRDRALVILREVTQVFQRDFRRAAGFHHIVIRHGFNVLNGVVVRVFVVAGWCPGWSGRRTSCRPPFRGCRR